MELDGISFPEALPKPTRRDAKNSLDSKKVVDKSSVDEQKEAVQGGLKEAADAEGAACPVQKGSTED